MPNSKKNTSKQKNRYSKFKKWLKSLSKLTLFMSIFAGLLLVAIVVAVIINRKPPAEPTPEITPTIEVRVTEFGETGISESAVGVIDDLSAITLVAQSAGPVKKMSVVEGDYVSQGELLLYQETAYNAGNSAAVARQIAQKNYELAEATLTNTVEVVAKNREQADLVKDNTDKLREISEQAVDETKNLLSITETQIDQLEQLVAEATESASTQSTYRASLMGATSTYNAQKSALRQLEYEVNTDNPPTKLQQIAKDLVYKTTELQLKSAELQRDIAGLNVRSAKIAEATTRVTAPFAGRIEALYVQPGEYVTPGTPVAKLSGDERLCLKITVSGNLASRIDESEPLQVKLGDEWYSLPVMHVSRTSVEGSLYQVLSVVPENLTNKTFDQAAVSVTLPLYDVSLESGSHFVPLDAVFITNTSSFVLVAKDGVAERRVITTGQIAGNAVEITEGLVTGEQVILDRRVIEGQQVSVQTEDQMTNGNSTQVRLD